VERRQAGFPAPRTAFARQYFPPRVRVVKNRHTGVSVCGAILYTSERWVLRGRRPGVDLRELVKANLHRDSPTLRLFAADTIAAVLALMARHVDRGVKVAEPSW
jgi:hypothetical protein